jgi:hypothetical protein
MVESAASYPENPPNPAEDDPKQTQDLVLKFLDAQFPLLYIEPTPKRVLINGRTVSGAGVKFTKPEKGRADG